jgi:hypothetical protein
MSNQYDALVIKSGIPTIIGTDTLRADRVSDKESGWSGTPDSGNAVQVSGALTLAKAVNTSTSPIVGVYDGISGSVVREGVVVASFAAGPTTNGETVYLSDSDGKLTNVKPTKDMLHEVGVVVDVASKKILLQQKPVIALPASPPLSIWIANSVAPEQRRPSDFVSLGFCDYDGRSQSVMWDGNYLWSSSTDDPQHINKYDPFTRARVAGEFLIGHPSGVQGFRFCFDGTNYWIVDYLHFTQSNVKKFDVNGNVLATVGTGYSDLSDVIYDGVGNVWVSGRSKWDIVKISIASNTVVGHYGFSTIIVRGYPCSDGVHIYVPVAGPSSPWPLYLAKIRLSDVALIGNYDCHLQMWAGIDGASCFDGTYVWVVGGDTTNGYLAKMRASDGAWIANYGPYLQGPNVVSYDGTNLWVSSCANNHVWKIRPSDGVTLNEYSSIGYVTAHCNSKHAHPWPLA